MFTTIIHPIRKALQLSCNEYCVLDTVHALSNNSDYGGWCYKSKQHIAEDLDLSRRAVIDIINALELKGYVLRNENGKFLKPSNEIRALFAEKSNWMIGVKNEDIKLLSLKFNGGCEESSQKVKCEESSQPTVQKLHTKCAETSHNIYNNTNTDIYNTPISPKGESEVNGNIEASIDSWIEAYLRIHEAYKVRCGYEDIPKDKLKRNYLRWMNMGRDPNEPLTALQNILKDDWQRTHHFPQKKLSNLFNVETVAKWRR